MSRQWRGTRRYTGENIGVLFACSKDVDSDLHEPRTHCLTANIKRYERIWKLQLLDLFTRLMAEAESYDCSGSHSFHIHQKKLIEIQIRPGNPSIPYALQDG